MRLPAEVPIVPDDNASTAAASCELPKWAECELVQVNTMRRTSLEWGLSRPGDPDGAARIAALRARAAGISYEESAEVEKSDAAALASWVDEIMARTGLSAAELANDFANDLDVKARYRVIMGAVPQTGRSDRPRLRLRMPTTVQQRPFGLLRRRNAAKKETLADVAKVGDEAALRSTAGGATATAGNSPGRPGLRLSIANLVAQYPPVGLLRSRSVAEKKTPPHVAEVCDEAKPIPRRRWRRKLPAAPTTQLAATAGGATANEDDNSLLTENGPRLVRGKDPDSQSSKRGPKPGEIDRFGAQDRALYPELESLRQNKHLSVSAAALCLAEQSKVAGLGSSSVESRAIRLAGRYRRDQKLAST